MLKKRYILPVVGAVAAMGTSYFMKKRNQDEETTMMKTFTNAGRPDEIDSLEGDQLENAKMVSEGSQFGVQYYSNMKEDVLKEIEEQVTS